MSRTPVPRSDQEIEKGSREFQHPQPRAMLPGIAEALPECARQTQVSVLCRIRQQWRIGLLAHRRDYEVTGLRPAAASRAVPRDLTRDYVGGRHEWTHP